MNYECFWNGFIKSFFSPIFYKIYIKVMWLLIILVISKELKVPYFSIHIVFPQKQMNSLDGWMWNDDFVVTDDFIS